MKRLGLLVLCGAALAAGPVWAAEGIELRARTSGELADLCGAKPGSAGADAKSKTSNTCAIRTRSSTNFVLRSCAYKTTKRVGLTR